VSDLQQASFGQRVLGAATRKVQQVAASAARDPNAAIANGWLIFYFGLLVAMLVFVVGAVAEWHDGAGQGSIFVDIVWRVSWVGFQMLKTVLIVLLVIWGYRRFTKLRGHAKATRQ